MARKQTQEGDCAICGTHGELTFEHIPPRDAFNWSTVLQIEFEKILAASEVTAVDQVRGRQQQGGAGGFYTCHRCNHFCGREYAPAYGRWVRQALHLDPSVRDPKIALPFIIRPLNVLKQVMAMFCCVNHGFGKRHHATVEKFILSTEAQELPEDWRVYAYCYLGPRAKQQGIVGSLNVARPGSVVLMSEIVMRPLGFLLTMHEGPQRFNLAAINYFQKFRFNQEVELWMTLPRVDVQPLIPGDYRSDKEVQKTIEENNAIMREKQQRQARDAGKDA